MKQGKIINSLQSHRLVKDTFENNTPILFKTKQKKFVSKPLIHITSDTGKTRHFTPASQE